MFKKKKVTFWNKKTADLTVADGMKITGISMLIGLLPLAVIGVQEAISDRREKKEREKREQKHLESIINGTEDSDTTW